jgi:hypothetical protein
MGSLVFDMNDLHFYVRFCPGEFYFPMCYTHISFLDWVIQLMYMYDHQFMDSDLVIKRHDSYSWYPLSTIKALVEAVVSNDGFWGMFAPLIIARPLFVQ